MRRTASGKGGRVIAGLALIALAGAAQAMPVKGQKLTVGECASIRGGETYVLVNRERSCASVTSIPRDSFGMDYSRASTYQIEVRNVVTTKLQDGKNDKYRPTQFPAMTVTMEVRNIPDKARKERYGSSSGQWIATDAVTTVVAYPLDAKGQPDMNKPFLRDDSGYFWHSNNAVPFGEAYSAGCLLSRQKDLDRVIATLAADRGSKRLTLLRD